MKEVLCEIGKRIHSDLHRDPKNSIRLILKMYNDYQEDVCDGIEYIFNLHDKDDLVCCVNGGLEASEIATLVSGMGNGKSEFFCYGLNYGQPYQMNMDELIDKIVSCIGYILPCVLTYPNAFDSYKEVYKRYFTPYFLEMKFF